MRINRWLQEFLDHHRRLEHVDPTGASPGVVEYVRRNPAQTRPATRVERPARGPFVACLAILAAEIVIVGWCVLDLARAVT